MEEVRNIWTIGHSTHTADKFIEMLQSFKIQTLVDIRSFPGSRRYPHFNKEILKEILQQHEINYVHEVKLGGRRKPSLNSVNQAWRNASFRGYADYMETNEFKIAAESLEALAKKTRCAYMCSEATWWRCHRALLSDYMKVNGWNVNHIMSPHKSTAHTYTAPARVDQGELFYDNVNGN
jgi:uncharacterized protein (DUF488 family)